MLTISSATTGGKGAPALESDTPETGSVTAPDSSTEKRRTTRIKRRLPILVKGTDALGDRFDEETNTLDVSCHGCRYVAKRYVSKGSTVTVEISSPGMRLSRVATGRVAWVQRPSRYQHNFAISLEFELPQNIWGIIDPPADWLPYSQSQIMRNVEPAPQPPDLQLPPQSHADQPDDPGLEEIDISNIREFHEGSADEALQENILATIESSLGRIVQPAINASLHGLLDPLAAAIAEKISQIIDNKLESKVAQIVKQEVQRAEQIKT